MSANAVEIRGLSKTFKSFSLGPLDLTVPRGAIYGFVGPNGAGKTTTIDLIFGMGANDAGRITVLGFDHRRDDAAMKREVGYASPELNFQPWGKVGRAIEFVRAFRPTWDNAYCDQLLNGWHLKRSDSVWSLSFGNKIKLALVLAMAWRPRVLVLDEPTVGLDAIAKDLLFTELLSAVRDGDRTVLISSHGLQDIERFADHVGMIKNGRMLFEGAIPDLLERYRMVDLDGAIASRKGLWPQRVNGSRTRALVDVSLTSLERLAQSGARLLEAAPVTLQEIFVSLGRD